MSKIQLSEEEMQLVRDPSWILTKHRVIEKVYLLFGNLSAQMQAHTAHHNVLPATILAISPKISKGEQYEAMPWVVLDYPRFFSREDVFAVRSFFWWGHYFSITLHLKGKFFQQYNTKIVAAAKEWKDYYWSADGNEFSFNLEGENYYLPANADYSVGAETAQQLFLKISYKISFEEWNNAEQKLMQAFERFISVAESN